MRVLLAGREDRTAIAAAAYEPDCGRIGRVHGIAPADWRLSLARCLDRLLGPVKENGA